MLKRYFSTHLTVALVCLGSLFSPSVLAETPKAEIMLNAVQHLRMGQGEQAVALWKPLAEGGFADAQFNLGIVYLHGDGVVKNAEEAIKWFRLAAEQGDRQAQQQLGVMILHGVGIAANPEEGYRWINKKHHEHMQHGEHLAGERQRAAQLIWQSDMRESYNRNRGVQAAQVVADLRRRAGMPPAGTELAAR
ncbi:tetratricopeptide repeat protein [Propionivibrio sp.]|uniref:tetratricopeptide repeat protein n=1 Tax=Propionivibrio sp. TaxID=2212460 RepID=UPI003BF026C9